MWMVVCLYVSPVVDWGPVKGGPCPSDNINWATALKDKMVKLMDGWMDGIVSQCFLVFCKFVRCQMSMFCLATGLKHDECELIFV